MTQHHLVFGAGLIGGHLAGALLSQQVPVSVVGRENTRKAMANGLITSDYLEFKAEVPAPAFVDPDGPVDQTFDIIWLTVKCTAVANAIESLRKLVSAGTTIICCQNGLGSDLVLRDAFPDNNIVTAVVGYNVAELEQGHWHRSTEGKLVIEASAITEQVAGEIACDLLPVSLSDDILAEQWAKLQLNLANPVNALSDIPVKAMTEDAGFRRIIAALMNELLQVTSEMGLNLPKVTAVPGHWIPRLLNLPTWAYRIIAQKTLAIDPTARTSMWWDLSGQRQTEIDFLNGAVVRQGEELGIDCPVNRRIVELIHQVEKGEHQIGLTAEQLTQQLFG